jgi:hypothetical protein
MQAQFVTLTPFENFLFALKANESKRQYPHRLDKFLTFMELQGTIEEKCSKHIEFESFIGFDSNHSYSYWYSGMMNIKIQVTKGN